MSRRKAGPGAGAAASPRSLARRASPSPARLTFRQRRAASAPCFSDPFNVFIEDGGTTTVDEFGGQGGTEFYPYGGSSVINASDLEAALESANVDIYTIDYYGEGGCCEEGGGEEAGNITVGAPLAWDVGTRLSLFADGEIIIAQPITARAGTLSLHAGHDFYGEGGSGGARITTPRTWNASDGSPRTGGNGAVDVGTFILGSGDWSQVAPSLPAFSTGDFRIADLTSGAGSSSSFLRALGGDGSAGKPLPDSGCLWSAGHRLGADRRARPSGTGRQLRPRGRHRRQRDAGMEPRGCGRGFHLPGI